ncbi:hypothetical protein HCJ75_10355 [Listeria welshimeri]|nr:hypothetical protein [Listeria welshimeri]MBC1992435.1 hypothetical protein [Listeria welshimeri]MBC2027816.1 hypothetical protein [Listeria welshimeri]
MRENMQLDLMEIIQDEITIGTFKEENRQNKWTINMKLSFEEWKSFFECLIEDRRKKVKKLGYENGMMFYAWGDYQSGQIRFSLTSKINEPLPFSSEIKLVETIDVIINNYILDDFNNFEAVYVLVL